MTGCLRQVVFEHLYLHDELEGTRYAHLVQSRFYIETGCTCFTVFTVMFIMLSYNEKYGWSTGWASP